MLIFYKTQLFFTSTTIQQRTAGSSVLLMREAFDKVPLRKLIRKEKTHWIAGKTTKWTKKRKQLFRAIISCTLTGREGVANVISQGPSPALIDLLLFKSKSKQSSVAMTTHCEK